MSAAAALAIKAAKGYRTWGARNARAFVLNKGRGGGAMRVVTGTAWIAGQITGCTVRRTTLVSARKRRKCAP